MNPREFWIFGTEKEEGTIRGWTYDPSPTIEGTIHVIEKSAADRLADSVAELIKTRSFGDSSEAVEQALKEYRIDDDECRQHQGRDSK